LSVAVLLSLALSVTVVPLMARWAERTHPSAHDAAHSRVAASYERYLASVLRRPALAIGFAVVLAAITVVLFVAVGTGFLPRADEGGFVIDYVTPAGSALEESDRQVREVERILAKSSAVAAYSRRTGSELGIFATHLNKGDILVRLKPRSRRTQTSEQVIEELRPKLQAAMPLAEIEFVQLLQDMLGDLEGSPTPVEVKIFGDDPDVLAQMAEPVEAMLEKVPGVVDVVGVQRGSPELTWSVDPVAARRVGLTAEEVSTQLSADWLGDVATELRLGDRLVPVRVRLPDAIRFDERRQPDTLLRTPDRMLVPLSAIARPVRTNGQTDLMRENLRQMALVTARLEERDLGSAVAEIQERLAQIKLPVGYTYEVGGQYESQRQAFRELLTVFGLAAVLVFTILVIHFRAFTPAALILLAAPLSLGGALLLLIVTGTELNVSSAMGLILLVGLIVKNGIMLLDLSRHRVEAGEPLAEAVAHAGRVRLRPILMTTLCTLFGLLPLALGLGAGAELQKPLALAVIGGLTVSTLVTLLIVPSVYVALQGLRRK
jgi:multidrug efflux pump subunit AcrB